MLWFDYHKHAYRAGYFSHDHTLAAQAHNKTNKQFTLFHETHRTNLKACMRKCDESIQKYETYSKLFGFFICGMRVLQTTTLSFSYVKLT